MCFGARERAMNMECMLGDIWGMEKAAPLFVQIGNRGYPMSFASIRRTKIGADAQTCIYIIEAPDLGRMKVGRGDKPSDRLAELQIGSPTELTIHSTYEVPARVAGWIERHAHRLLQSSRTHGEWFQCRSQTAVSAVKSAISWTPQLEAFLDQRLWERPEWQEATRRSTS